MNSWIPVISKPWLSIFLVLVLQALVIAASTDTLNSQLIEAVKRGDRALVSTLLNRGANINACDPDRWPVLILAVYIGNSETVELLLNRGVDVNARSAAGKTALMEAAARDHQLREPWYHELWSKCMRLYTYGFMGPRYPFGGEDPQIVKMLLQEGAEVNAQDKIGWTALKRAQNRGVSEIVELLKAHGAKQ